MAVPRFVNLSEEVVNATEEKSIAKRTKDATEVSRTLFKSKMWKFSPIELNKLVKTACLSWYEYSTQLEQNMNKAFSITEFRKHLAI